MGTIESHLKPTSRSHEEGGLMRESSPDKFPDDDALPILD